MSGNPAADYSEGASHVLAVIHQILGHHRALEARWHARKVKLHQRLALRYSYLLHVISFSISFVYEDDTNSHILIIFYIFFTN